MWYVKKRTKPKFKNVGQIGKCIAKCGMKLQKEDLLQQDSILLTIEFITRFAIRRTGYLEWPPRA